MGWEELASEEEEEDGASTAADAAAATFEDDMPRWSILAFGPVNCWQTDRFNSFDGKVRPRASAEPRKNNAAILLIQFDNNARLSNLAPVEPSKY